MSRPVPEPVRAPIETHSEAETQAAGRELSKELEAGSVVLIAGELGAGKTAFVRGMGEGLGVAPEDVNSPTFTLIQEYRGGRLNLFHVDLYRLRSVEVDELGLDELMSQGAVTAVEWPDRLPRPVPGALRVSIEHVDETTRTIRVALAGMATR